MKRPSGLMIRAPDQHSEGLGFESQLDPRIFSVGLLLTLSTKTSLITVVTEVGTELL